MLHKNGKKYRILDLLGNGQCSINFPQGNVQTCEKLPNGPSYGSENSGCQMLDTNDEFRILHLHNWIGQFYNSVFSWIWWSWLRCTHCYSQFIGIHNLLHAVTTKPEKPKRLKYVSTRSWYYYCITNPIICVIILQWCKPRMEWCQQSKRACKNP